MANKPFEYTIVNPLERPTSTDINQLQAQAHYDLRQFAYELFGRQNGFLGYSFNPEPNSPADGTFYIQQGVAFQYGAAENTFGTPPIPGLVDSYQQKAVTTINRQITAEGAPAGSGEKRYDLLMIRAPAGDERLKNSTSVGIYTPSLGTFDATDKYKTLTSSLDEFAVEPIASTGTPTSPIVYKSGNVFTGAWDPVNKPAVDVGYLGVAYIRRYQGQTAIEAADIEDARTLLTVGMESLATLPVNKGGTGNSSTVALTGSVAWFDNTLDQIKYTQAVTGLYDTPVSGYLLASNASGEPTWIAPGTAGQVLVSTGTAWEAEDWTRYYSTLNSTYTASVNSNSYTPITQLSLSNIALRKGNARIELSPNNSSDAAGLFWEVATPSTFEAKILVEVTLPNATVWNYVFRYQAGNNQDYPITLPSVTLLMDQVGNCSVAVSAMTAATGSTLTFRNCDLVVTQG